MSNNPMARTLFLNLSASSNNQASIKSSRKVINDWLSNKNFIFPEMVVHNGSGLSREVRISPRNLSSLLIDALVDANAFDWIYTLPRAGIDGTVSKRFKNKPIVGNAWLKTGSLRGVQAYSGYIRTAKKNWFAVTIFINHRLAEKAKQTMDNVIEWVYLHK
jgi:D-alanyl-D-alanine carboxypeptidase/D-alanyl-D-alanine-endopeptidase (penicillin-binding protein 4)